MLKEAHISRDFDALRNHPTLRRATAGKCERIVSCPPEAEEETIIQTIESATVGQYDKPVSTPADSEAEEEIIVKTVESATAMKCERTASKPPTDAEEETIIETIESVTAGQCARLVSRLTDTEEEVIIEAEKEIIMEMNRSVAAGSAGVFSTPNRQLPGELKSSHNHMQNHAG
ncbi:hypothetical protein C8R44DRAFT_741330 [Mycena epipterygia]|nr:hypothetical protein C8R44DRAFT_741330 [Mycena epipterygia]